ncbi:MAG: isoamylase early set domain-containing protein [Nitrospiraceae bacterium]|nr:isoamylase early set domain-containing protein [Nitrospiraceae bacterium]
MKQRPTKKASSSRSPRRPASKPLMTFEYFDPAATTVTLVGDFNQWDQKGRPMKRDAGGLWKVALRLAPGRYEYKFVINGERWEEDPLNLNRVRNEHGTFNSIRTVDEAPPDDHASGNETAIP